MIAKIFSTATVGLEGVLVEVEVDIEKKGFPSFAIVGLPDKAVEEAKDRVRAAIKNIGAKFPSYRITVNLAPADLPKVGPAYDLPIALGILLSFDQMQAEVSDSIFLGELSLDGRLRHTPGVLPSALLGKENGFKKIFLPAENAAEASIVEGIEVMPVESLKTLFEHFLIINQKPIEPHPHQNLTDLIGEEDYEFDFSQILGQEQAKRALEIASAGFHNLRMAGPPGAGKTLLARALPSILPKMTPQEALEVTKIYSITGNLKPGEALIKQRPFRAPHHTTSRIGLIGGGSKVSPGEISLAHRGALFLDEFPEFPRHVLEALRQPLEDGFVTISRAAGRMTFPSKFILITAENPCPCGFLGEPNKNCTCTPHQISNYKKRVSGPVSDRIDLHIEVPAVKTEELMAKSDPSAGSGQGKQKVVSSKEIRGRVQEARDRQNKRYQDIGIFANGELTSKNIHQFCQMTADSEDLLRKAVSQLALSARSYHKVVKVAKTIADLAGKDVIEASHIAEALQYRPRD